MVKIVYFDEESAIDYINIKDGGKKMKEGITKLAGETGANLQTEGEVGVDGNSLSKFDPFNFFIAKISGGIEGNIQGTVQKIVNTSISNTVLTDYIKKAKRDKNIEKITKSKLSIYPESMAYYKMYTPYIKMINISKEEKSNTTVDLSSLDGILTDVKGYQELICKYNEKEVILRFNMKVFKNNYKMSDILKMDLKYFAVKVGKSSKTKMNLLKELEIEPKKVVTSEEILGEDISIDKEILDVYDVVLAGVSYE